VFRREARLSPDRHGLQFLSWLPMRLSLRNRRRRVPIYLTAASPQCKADLSLFFRKLVDSAVRGRPTIVLPLNPPICLFRVSFPVRPSPSDPWVVQLLRYVLKLSPER